MFKNSFSIRPDQRITVTIEPAEPDDWIAKARAYARPKVREEGWSDADIDRIIKEPVGGAHRDPEAAAKALGDALAEELEALSGKTAKQLRRLREDRLRVVPVWAPASFSCSARCLFSSSSRASTSSRKASGQR